MQSENISKYVYQNTVGYIWDNILFLQHLILNRDQFMGR